jgi:TolA-binding protein
LPPAVEADAALDAAQAELRARALELAVRAREMATSSVFAAEREEMVAETQVIMKEKADELRERARTLAKAAGADVIDFSTDFAFDVAREQMQAAMAKVRSSIDIAFARQASASAPRPPTPPTPPTPPRPSVYVHSRRVESAERTYERGQRALDERRWEEALEAFTTVAAKEGSRKEGAYYWKAYTLNKLGRRDDALATIAELRKAYPSSRWLDDAKVLEAEIRRSSGQPARPEAESDDELKLLALNGLVQSDPERAVPLLENLLRGAQTPKLKERALYVLAQSNTPRAKQLLEQVARGGAGNPDLQLKALRYVIAVSRRADNRNLLWEIYSSSSDAEVKRAVINGFIVSKDKERLLQIARTEKSPNLRMEAVAMLGAAGAQSELWTIYQQEGAVEVKEQILHSMVAAGAADRLAEAARSEKDPKLRRTAIRSLGAVGAARSGDALVSLYAGENDPQVKKAIIDGLYAQKNAKALVELARKESNASAKRDIVSRLSNMKSKEAADYLMELLK